MPTLAPWMKQTLIGLFALYVAELLGWALKLPLDALVWHPLGTGFNPVQMASRFLIQGPNNVFVVLVSLLMLYFFLPAMSQTVTRTQLGQALASGALFGTLLPLALDLTGFGSGMVMGWGSITICMVVLFGLARPNDSINLYFLFPIRGIHFVWGSLGFALLMFLSASATGGTMAAAQTLGMWVGAWAWWNYRGPGRRRTDLKRSARTIEKELKRFQVIEGGRVRGNRPGDDTIH